MNKIALLSVFIILAHLSQGQTPLFQWAKRIGSFESDGGQSIAKDSSGNIYTIGNLNSNTQGQLIISKLDANGNLVWSKIAGGSSNVDGISIALDPSGNIYSTGQFKNTADFDPGPGISSLTSAGYEDLFILKLDSLGNFIWVKQIGGVMSDGGMAVTTDISGNFYITGYFSSTVDFDPGPSVTNLTPTGGSDIFISKFDAQGNFAWARHVGDGITSDGRAIVADVFGNVYTTGWFEGVPDFDPGPGITTLTSTAGSMDIFILKLDASGNFVWAKQMGGPLKDEGLSLFTDVLGNVYSTGIYGGTADFDPGPGFANLTSAAGSNTSSLNIYISKLDVNGNFILAKQIGDILDDVGTSITVDGSGNIYLSGCFSGTVDFDPGPGTFNLISLGDLDGFILKLDAAANFVWVKQIGGSGNDVASSSILDGFNNIYSTGFFDNTCSFMSTATTLNLISQGAEDIFVSKINQSNAIGIQENFEKDYSLVYPNPTRDVFRLIASTSGNNYIEIYNCLGTLIMSSTNINGLTDTFDLKSQPEGVYIVKLRNESGRVIIQKVIKQ